MSKKWQMRRYQEGDEEKIVFLMNSVKYGWHSLEYWRWKYKKNPFGFFKNIFIAEDEGRLVGHSAIIPIGFKFFDRTLLGAQDLDAVTLPEYRLSGIYTNLARTNFRKARKDIKFTYGIPGKFIYGALFKVGFNQVCHIPKMYKVLNLRDALRLNTYLEFLKTLSFKRFIKIFKTLKALFKKENLSKTQIFYLQTLRDTLLILTGILQNPFHLMKSEPKVSSKDTKIRKVSHFDERIDEFWERAKKNFPIIVERTRKFLNWRYVEIPEEKYTIFIAEKDKKIMGYIVLKLERREGMIIDVLTLNEDVFRLLIQKSLSYFREKKTFGIYLWMLSHTNYFKILKEYGFSSASWLAGLISRIPILQGALHSFFIFFTSSLSEEMREELLCEKNWYLTLGDKDWK